MAAGPSPSIDPLTIQEIKGHRQQIVVTEVPFGVNKAMMVKKIDEIRLNKEIDGISRSLNKFHQIICCSIGML